MPVPKSKTVFISGSAYEYGIFGEEGKTFIRHLTRALLKNDFKIISGFGLGVGNHIVDEGLREMHRKNKENISDLLQFFPFPPAHHPKNNLSAYRDHMLSEAGIVIFIFGNKLEDIAIREAGGVLEEFRIACKHKALLIPVGASGYVSQKIWEEMMEHFDDYSDTRESYDLYRQLGRQDLHPLELIEIVIQIALQNEKKGIRQL